MKAPPRLPAAASPSCCRCYLSPAPSSPEYLLSKTPKSSAPPYLQTRENRCPSTPARIAPCHPPQSHAAPPNPPPISDDGSGPSACSKNLDNREEEAAKGAGYWVSDFAQKHAAPRIQPAAV